MIRRGLVASGGGSNIDVMGNALHEIIKAGINFDAAVGISSGAILASAYGTGLLPKLVEITNTIKDVDVYKGKLTLLNGIWAYLKGKDSILDNTPLINMFNDIMVKPINIDVVSYGAVNLEKSRYEKFIGKRGDNIDIDFLVASTIVPPLWEPIKMKSVNGDINHFVDGGLIHHKPIGHLIDLEFNKLIEPLDEIWIISSTPINLKPNDNFKTPKNFIGWTIKSLELILSNNMRMDTFKFLDKNHKTNYKTYKYFIVEPEMNLKNMWDFDSKDFLEYGKQLGINAVNQYKKL